MSNKWEMPDPVYRSSDGETVQAGVREPQGKQIDGEITAPSIRPDDEGDVLELAAAPPRATAEEQEVLATMYAPPGITPEAPPAAEKVSSATASASLTSDIQPQPYVSEQFSTDEITLKPQTEAVRPAQRSSLGGGVTIAVAVIVLLLLAIAAAVGYWILFIRGH